MASNSESDEDELELAMLAAVSTLIIVTENGERKRNPRSMWVRPMFHQRAQVGAYNLLMNTFITPKGRSDNMS